MADRLADVHPAYRDRLSRLLGDLRHRSRRLDPALGLILAVEKSGVRLAAAVQPGDHIVTTASFECAEDPLLQGILESVCRYVEAKPILEGSDHGALYAENEMRDPAQLRPVAGILTPANAHPHFRLSEELLRDLLREYRKRTGFSSTENFHDARASAEWVALASENKQLRLQQALDRMCAELHLPLPSIRVVGIQDHVRVIVDLNGDLSPVAKQSHLMHLEKGLRDRVEASLELYLPERKDMNRIRRLAPSGKRNVDVGNG